MTVFCSIYDDISYKLAYNNQPQNWIILQMGKWGTRAHLLGWGWWIIVVLSEKFAQLHKSAYFAPAMIDER